MEASGCYLSISRLWYAENDVDRHENQIAISKLEPFKTDDKIIKIFPGVGHVTAMQRMH